MIHAEMISIVYSIFTTFELPIPGKRTEKEVDDILDTFMMVFAFGINLDVSIVEDVQKARTFLQSSHSAWPQLQSFAKEVKQSASASGALDFEEIVQLVEKISEGYAQWQGKDCLRAKEELMSKPSYREGRVGNILSEVEASHTIGRRSLFTENVEELEKLGVLNTVSGGAPEIIIPNYVNSQSMCLSTASLFTVCCVNECDDLLGRLEREVASPAAQPSQLARLMAALPGPGLAEPLLQELHALVDNSGLIPLHGRALADWMHRAFPLACPAPHNQKINNPKTPDEWMGESGLEVQELEEMISEIAQVLARYTTMGKEAGPEVLIAEDPASDANQDVARIRASPLQKSEERSLVATIFRVSAMLSMMVVVAVAGNSALQAGEATSGGKDKVDKDMFV